jgi:hypothetical protein
MGAIGLRVQSTVTSAELFLRTMAQQVFSFLVRGVTFFQLASLERML